MNLPGYSIQDAIHEGKQTVVYRAKKADNGEPVVVKVLKSEYPSQKELSRFRQEYEITKKIGVDGVVKVLSLDDYNNGLALVLEDFGGISLKEAIANKKVSLQAFLKIALKVTETLGQIHKQEVIHKDIKPHNILINPKTGEVKIIDFGIASLLSRESQSVISPNMLEGTLTYISPEQTGRMNRTIDYRTDFYSLGVTFYEMLAGHPPFEAADPMEIVHCHIARPAVPLHEINSSIPVPVSRIIEKLLSKNAEDRYQSAFGLRGDLLECLRQLSEGGSIKDFEPGRRDKSEKLQIPQKLYGRTREINKLLATFDRVTREGNPELMLVAGYSGIGKSALVNEVQKPIVEYRGYFIGGKCDQFKRNIPYNVVIQAFQELVREVLTESKERIDSWREQLAEALGPNGQVLIDLIPEIELIIGRQPAVPELPPAESQTRLNNTFLKFIRTFAQKRHPLAIFLDDLQWADSGTLNLIQLLMTDADTRFVFLIGAYRDNEVDNTHPLVLTLGEIKKQNVEVGRVALKPLREDDVNMLVSDTLGSDRGTGEGLSKLIFKKTNGNPFFVNEFMKSLYQEGLLVFDTELGEWQWSEERIEAKGFTDNVVDFMAGNIQKLPEGSQESLKMAACIGNIFDLHTLSVVTERTQPQALDEIWKAVDEGLVFPVDDSYKLIDAKSTEEDGKGVKFRFVHDRVQQAAYALISNEDKKPIHLKIGRLLLSDVGEESLDENIFSILNHVNAGADLISDRDEKERVAILNFNAGKKARASAAYGPAIKFLSTGLASLPDTKWDSHYQLTYDLNILLVECEYLTGNFERTEELFEEILKNAKSKLDKGRVFEIKVIQANNRNELDAACAAGREGLKLFGHSIPKNPVYARVLGYVVVSQVLRRFRKIESLIDLPEMKDEEKIFVARLLTHLTSSFYGTNQNEFAIDIIKAINLILANGNSASGAYMFNLYAALAGSGLGLYADGEKYAQLGLRIGERFGDLSLLCRANFAYGTFVCAWTHHARDSLEYNMKSYKLALEGGDNIYSTYSILNYCFTYLTLGNHLDETSEIQQKYTDYVVKKVKDDWIGQLMEAMNQYLLALRGKTDSRTGFSDEHFNEEEHLRIIRKEGGGKLNWYYTLKMMLLFYMGEYEEAFRIGEIAETFIVYSFAAQITIEQNFYNTLVLAALVDNPAFSSQKKKLLKRIRKNIKLMKTWSKNTESNFYHKYLLMSAELARITGREKAAMDYYDQAILSAREFGYFHHEALANELAAKFYLGRKKDKVARTFMTDARYGYVRWGAEAKVADLDEKYPEIKRKIEGGIVGSEMGTTTMMLGSTGETGDTTARTSSLDMGTVMKATQAISSEIFLDKLLTNLMNIVIENAGAQKGFLLLEKDGDLVIEAEGATDMKEPRVLQSISIESGELLPRTVVQYVQRTMENVVEGNASKEGRYTRDPYIEKNQPRSVLCSPITKQGELIGILYLENNLSANAFTQDRLDVLKIISSQAAISLENARLVAEETERQKLQKEMEMAKDVQMSILPEVLEDEAYNVTAHMTPAEQVGGDYYDYYCINGTRWIAIGDVTGHGLNSGLMMLMAQTGFSTYLNTAQNPDSVELFSALNKTLHDNMATRTKQNLYMTFTAIKADADGNFEHVGKHEDILVYRQSEGKVETIKSDGFWMGVIPDVSSMVHKSNFKLNPGDFITLFTDGVIECRNKQGEQFDTSGLIEVIEANASQGIVAVKEAVVKACMDFMDVMDDDITLFLIQKK